MVIDYPLSLQRRLDIRDWQPFACFERVEDRQRQNQIEVVVGGDPVVTLDAAPETAMDDDVLAPGTCESGDGRHRGSARARPIAGCFRVDVARIKAERAVIAVASPGGKGTDQLATMVAAEIARLMRSEARRRAIAICLGHGRPLKRHPTVTTIMQQSTQPELI
jgi:hypothetical protein